MKSLTPELTARQLGWKAARQSLKKAVTRTAPKPPKLPRFSVLWPPHWGTTKYYARITWTIGIEWLKWIPRTIKLWRDTWKHRHTEHVKDYEQCAKEGMSSREIFKRQGRKMHLTEDEIFEAGKKIFVANVRDYALEAGHDIGEPFLSRETNIPTGKGKFPTKLTKAQQKAIR